MTRPHFLPRTAVVRRSPRRTAVLRRTAVSIAVAAVLMVALSSCRVGAGPTPAEEVNPVVTHTWSVTADLVGSLAVAGDTVVSYVRGPGGGLRIVAWDAATGLELWRDEAVPGQVTRSVEVSAQVATVSGRVLVPYLRQRSAPDGAWMEVVVADLRTGAVVGRDWGAVWATSRPAECADAAGVCFTGWTKAHDGRQQRAFRLDAETGVFGTDPQTPSPPSGRFLGGGVFATDDRPPEGDEMIGFSAAGAIAWQRPYREVFGENSSSDEGWSWRYTDADGPLIGWGRRPAPPAGSRDFTQQRTVALARSDGAVIWSLAGVSPCPGVGASEAVVTHLLPLCRWNSGVLRWPADGSEPFFEDFDLDLVGVDRATGEVAWALPFGGDGSELLAGDVSFHSALAVRPLVLQGATVLVDTIAGTTQPAAPGVTYACARHRAAYAQPNPDDPAAPPDLFNAGVSVFACDIERVAVSEFSADGIRMAGVDAGRSRHLVGGEAGITMYQPGN